jgi:hypothetical protein
MKRHGVEDDADLARLEQVNSAAAFEIAAAATYLLEGEAGVQKLVATREQQVREAWGNAQDAKLIERFPELADDEHYARAQDEVLETMLDAGYTEPEVAELNESGALRDHRVQAMLFDYSRLKRAEAAAKAARPTSQPRPLRPGTSNGSASSASNLASAAERGDMASYIKMRNAGRG